MSSKSYYTKSRNLGLDILRAIAVILVMGRHFHDVDSKAISSIEVFWNRGGWIGVDIFFVLSGFLVSGILFKEYIKTKKVNIKRFLIRRGLRIYPEFWIMIIASCVSFNLANFNVKIDHIIHEFLFIQNYFRGIWNHTWSLAIEEHFYILLAIIIYFLTKKGSRFRLNITPKIFIFVALLCLSSRTFLMLTTEPRHFFYGVYYFRTHNRIDSLFFGVFLSYLFYFKNLSSRISSIKTAHFLFLGVLLLLPPFFYELEENIYFCVFGFTFFYIGAGSLLLAFMRFDTSSNSLAKTLGKIGAASYSIYLWHMLVDNYMYGLIHDRATYLIVFPIFSIFFGLLTSKLIERPILIFRNRYFP